MQGNSLSVTWAPLWPLFQTLLCDILVYKTTIGSVTTLYCSCAYGCSGRLWTMVCLMILCPIL